MKFCATILLLASAVAASIARSIADVKADCYQISSLVKALDEAITAIPASGASLSQGVAINTNLYKLQNALDKGTADVKATPPFSNADSKAILAIVKGFVPTIRHLLINIVTKKASIVGIPFPGIAGLVCEALKKLQSHANAFEDVLIESDSSVVKGEAASVKAEVDAAFAKAVKGYC